MLNKPLRMMRRGKQVNEDIDQQGAAIVALTDNVSEEDVSVAAAVLLPDGIQVTRWDEIHDED